MNPKAQIVHAKSRLSARGEYVPDVDELAALKRKCEEFFRNNGFSWKLAKMYTSNLFRDSSEMLEAPPATDDDKGESEPSKADQRSPETVEEVEVFAGLDSFKSKQEAYELDKIMRRYFR